jgi:membrane-associated phospholipid phosphatase
VTRAVTAADSNVVSTIASPAPRIGLRAASIRGSEWVILLFLAYAAAAATLAQLIPALAERIIVSNLVIALAYLLLIHFDGATRVLALSVIRDWAPLAVLLFVYQEMGWFAHPLSSHPLESLWVGWDRDFLHGGAKTAIEFFGPVAPSLLEMSYTLVYAVAPFCLAVLYFYRRRGQAEQLLFILAIAVLLCYGQFPFWPSEPPRIVFAGQDLPTVETVFRRFNLWMLSNAGIHTSVFPSAHVAAAFACAFGMRKALPEHRWVSRFLLVLALAIALATVYGRYHYLADAVAGFAMALVALAASRIAERVAAKPHIREIAVEA